MSSEGTVFLDLFFVLPLGTQRHFLIDTRAQIAWRARSVRATQSPGSRVHRIKARDSQDTNSFYAGSIFFVTFSISCL